MSLFRRSLSLALFALALFALVLFAMPLFSLLPASPLLAQEKEPALDTEPSSEPAANSVDKPSPDAEQATAEPTKEQSIAYDAAMARFQMSRHEFAIALAEQQETFLRYINREVRTPAAKQQYAERRELVRHLMKETFGRALDATDTGVLSQDLVQFIETVVQHRNGIDFYDAQTFEAAAKMLDAGLNFQFLVEAGARSALVTGDFESAGRLFKVLGTVDKFAKIDAILYSNLDRYRDQWEIEQKIREQEISDDNLPRVKLKTTQGDVIIELFLDQAPTTVSNFIRLVEDGFYDGLDFYQVIDHALALTGDPASTGEGNSGKYIVDEHQREGARHGLRGSLAMAKIPIGDTAKLVPHSASSQFAILYLPVASISEQQTVFGCVIEGMDVVSRFRRVDPTKEKEKGEVVLPADSIIEATVIRHPETLPEPEYFVPPVR